MSADRHLETRGLLVAELDGPRFSHPCYLRWFYDDNPRGAAIEEHVDDANGKRIGHYGILPTRFRHADAVIPFIFSSNVATDSTARQSGLFRKMAGRMYERAAATGAPAMVGVGNDASTVVVVDRFGWHRIAPMRATITWGLPSRNVTAHRIDAEFLVSAEFERLTADLERLSVRDYALHWDTDYARWRLARPDGHYVLHVTADALAVSVKTKGPLGLPFAVLLKVWPRSSSAATPSSSKVRLSRLVGNILTTHRAIACVYAGWNAQVKVRGIRVPHRFQPSPLNVVLKVLDSSRIDPNTFKLETFELLDMDAY